MQRWSLLLFAGLEKVIQLGWFGAPTKLSPSLFKELGIKWIKDQEGS